jgi:hypothetical protein
VVPEGTIPLPVYGFKVVITFLTNTPSAY